MNTPPSFEAVRAALECIPPDVSHDERVRLAFAVFDGIGDAGADLWHAWAARRGKPNASEDRSTWKSARKRGPVTVGTLFGMAKDHGFSFEAVRTPAQRPTAGELKAQAAARREAGEREAADKLKGQQAAALEAAKLWASASGNGASPYLDRKGVKAHGVRFAPGGVLLVPMHDPAGELCNVQTIRPASPADGGPDKLFVKGGRVSGALHLIGSPVGAPWVLVAEGYATAASCHEATGRPVAAAFNAGNLAHVVRVLRGRYPSARLLVCGDDDRATHQRTGKNPGRDKATEAARLARGLAVFPAFEGADAAGGSDFNDMHSRAGLHAVRDVIEAAIAGADAEQARQGPVSGRSTLGVTQAGKPAPAGRQRAARGGGDDAATGGRSGDRFRVDEDGVWFDGDDGGAPVRVCGPLTVEARACDERGEGAALVLRFDTPFRAGRRWLMPMPMLAGDGAAYRAALWDMGFPTPTDAKRRALLTTYLASRQPAEIVHHVPRVGWHGRCYVLPDETLGEPVGPPVIFHSEAGTEVNFAQRASLDAWCERIARLCVGNSRLSFAVSAAFAGPLLAWSPIKGGGGLHFVGDTSTGKTTGLLAAASVWGKGTENDPGSYMQKWRATSNGLEYQGEQHNDCTLILDELGQIEGHEAGPASYMLADGMGKTRGKAAGGLRHKPTWRLLFLSSGELTLAQHMEAAGKKMKGGQEVRLIPIPAEVQPGTCLETSHEFETGHELSEWIKRQAATCYGTAGRAWLLWLVDNLGRLPGLIRDYMTQFERRHVRDEMAGQVKRGARRFALVAAAGEIATREAGLTGWPEGEAMRGAGALFEAWLTTRPGGIGASEEATMLRDLRMHFLTCGEMNYKRWGVTDSDHAKATPYMYGWRKPVTQDERNAAGELVEVQRGATFYVQRDAFETVACKGHDWRRCLALLKSRDLLIIEPSGRADHRAKPPGESAVTVFRVKSEIIDAGSD